MNAETGLATTTTSSGVTDASRRSGSQLFGNNTSTLDAGTYHVGLPLRFGEDDRGDLETTMLRGRRIFIEDFLE